MPDAILAFTGTTVVLTLYLAVSPHFSHFTGTASGHPPYARSLKSPSFTPARNAQIPSRMYIRAGPDGSASSGDPAVWQRRNEVAAQVAHVLFRQVTGSWLADILLLAGISLSLRNSRNAQHFSRNGDCRPDCTVHMHCVNLENEQYMLRRSRWSCSVGACRRSSALDAVVTPKRRAGRARWLLGEGRTRSARWKGTRRRRIPRRGRTRRARTRSGSTHFLRSLDARQPRSRG
jgi:hypothetical protein